MTLKKYVIYPVLTVLLVGLLLGLAYHPAQAATCTWDGTTGDWSDSTRWSCGAVPGVGDDAIINGGTVSVNSAATVDNLSLTNGTLQGSATLTVTQTMDWTGGWQSGSGATVIPPGAALNASGSSQKMLAGSRTLNNQGTLTWSGTGIFNINQNSTAVIQNSGLFDVQADTALGSGQLNTTATFNNTGIFRKSGGTGVTTVATVLTFNNSGTVQVQAGTLRLWTGATSNSGGAFEVSSGATLQFTGGTHNLFATSAVSGAGQVRFDGATVNLDGAYTVSGLTTVSGGTPNFNSTVSLSSLDISGGTLSGSGVLTVTGTLNWTGGWQSGSGATVIAPGAALNASGSSSKTLAGSRTLENQGTITWSGTGTFSVNQNSTAVIQNSGLFDAQADAALGSGQLATTAAFNNAGIFRKSGGTGVTTVATVLTFNNSGTVQVQAGTLRLWTGATSTSGGTFEVSGGAVLEFRGGSHNLGSASTVSGTGEVLFSGATVNLEGAYTASGLTTVTTGSANFDNALSAGFGSLTHSGGTLRLDHPGVTLSGDFTRTGGSFLGGTGTLILNGGPQQNFTLAVPTTFHNLSVTSGTTLVEVTATDYATLNGALTNAGVVRKTKSAAAGANTFGLTGVTFEATALGSLASVTVERVGGDHPQASGQTANGQYWSITGTGDGFALDLTLPHSISPDTDAVACRYMGSGTVWDCDRAASTASTVTRSGVTQFSDWAVGSASTSGFELYMPMLQR